jgi:TetR/AcrR family transcriptional regulator, transcriptional repressor for nem operon
MPIVKTSKEEVIIKSAQVIRQQGYANTSMDDLAKACAIQKSHFYYYFKNKEDLMLAILKSAIDYFKDRIAIHATDVNLSPQEKIEKVLKRMANVFMYSEGGCLMGNTILESANANAAFMNMTRQFFDEFSRVLTVIYRAKYSEIYAQTLSMQVIQDIEGGIMMARLYKDEKYMMFALQRAMKHLE